MARSNKIKTIAEIGINHNGSLDIAKQIISWAKCAGFDYVKFQKRNPDLCVPKDQKEKMKSTPWGEMTYLDYKKKIEFGFHEYDEIDQFCLYKNMEWFMSVWDYDSACFAKEFCDIVKIPSALITHKGLLKYCRENFRKVLMSTGMSTEDEIVEAVDIGRPDVLFHCCADYPAKSENLNLKYIRYLKEKYPEIQIGYSGHEEGLTTTFAACAIGAEWIERHVTLDHSMWGSDQRVSVDPVGMIKLIRGIINIEASIGKYGPRNLMECEKSKRESLRK